MRLLLAVLTFVSFAFSAEAQMHRRPALAGAYKHELMTNLTSGIFASGKECKDCRSGTSLNVGASYLRSWQDNVQIGAEGRLINASEEVSPIGKSVTRIELLGVGVYNFSSDFADAIFAKAGLGFYSVPNSARDNYENQLGFFLGAGKRFSWFGNVAYAPELRLVKRGDIDIGFDIHVLNFSIAW